MRPKNNFETLLKDVLEKQISYARHTMSQRKVPEKDIEKYIREIRNPKMDNKLEWYLVTYNKPRKALTSQRLWADCNSHHCCVYGKLKRHCILYTFFPNLASYCFNELREETKDNICLKLPDTTNNWKYIFPS